MAVAVEELEKIADQDRLAIVGVAKNCGKTTTLNALLARRRGPMPALLSIGIDGEAEDMIMGTWKPPISVVEGQWLVTAQTAAERSTARLEYIRSLDVVTPLGELFICRARTAGEVVLAGLRHRREILGAIEALQEEGWEIVWVDGAYGRVAGAHPSVSRAVVVATGAIVAGSVKGVVERTADLITRLALEEVEEEEHRAAILMSQAEERCYLVDDERGLVALSVRSALVGFNEIRKAWSQSTIGIAIPGLISDGVAQQLLALGSGHRLLIPDGTALHLESGLWRRLKKRWEIRVEKTIPVVGISYNPASISGPGLDDGELQEALAKRWPETVIFNPARNN